MFTDLILYIICLLCIWYGVRIIIWFFKSCYTISKEMSEQNEYELNKLKEREFDYNRKKLERKKKTIEKVKKWYYFK